MNNNITKNYTVAMKVICTILFCTFSFLYLYYYQADILAYAQHALSNGQTHYNSMIGASIITASLYLLHLGISAITRMPRLAHALTYFPSLLLLAIITDISPNVDQHFTFGVWLWVFPLLIILYTGVVWVLRQISYVSQVNVSSFFSRMMWGNILALSVMFFMVGLVSNHNDIFHYRMHDEQCLLRGDMNGVLKTGEQSLVVDSNLTMLRAYALSKKGLLGERLFEHPFVGGSASLLPNGKNVRMMVYPASQLYQYLGVQIVQKLSPMSYLQYIIKHKYAKQPAGDYLLCGYLLDKDLDGFIHHIDEFYNLKENLPKHYREALVLYTHLRANPQLIYHNNVTDADFQDYQSLEHKYPDKKVRRTFLRDTYGNTYWYYYQYGY